VCVTVSLQPDFAFLMKGLKALCDTDAIGSDDITLPAFVVGRDDLARGGEGGKEEGEDG